MHKILTGIALISVLGFASEASACSCAPSAKTFYETVEVHNKNVESGKWTQGLQVVTGRVIEHLQLRRGPVATEMVFEVDHVIQGQVRSKRIIVEGDNGAQCSPYITNFPVGKTFLLAVQEGGAVETHYGISACGVYYTETKQAE